MWDVCAECGNAAPSYNSCRNRHCPKCQSLAQAGWLEQRRERILPVHYFHMVFTLPGELKPVGLRNRRLLYNLLLQAVSKTLLTLGGDPKRLGGLLGVTASVSRSVSTSMPVEDTSRPCPLRLPPSSSRTSTLRSVRGGREQSRTSGCSCWG